FPVQRGRLRAKRAEGSIFGISMNPGLPLLQRLRKSPYRQFLAPRHTVLHLRFVPGVLSKGCMMYKVSALIFALLCGAVSTPLMAQTTEAPPELIQPAKPTSPTGISGFASDLLHDQKDIWTSPLHINRGDFEWLAPTAAGAGVLFAF